MKRKRDVLHRMVHVVWLVILAAGFAGFVSAGAEQVLTREMSMAEVESAPVQAENIEEEGGDISVQEIEIVNPEEDFLLSGNGIHSQTDPAVSGAEDPPDDADLEIFLEEPGPDNTGENVDPGMFPAYSDNGDGGQGKPGGYESVPGGSDVGDTMSGGSNTDGTGSGNLNTGETVPGDPNADETGSGDLNTGETVPGDPNADGTGSGDLNTGETMPGDSNADGFASGGLYLSESASKDTGNPALDDIGGNSCPGNDTSGKSGSLGGGYLTGGSSGEAKETIHRQPKLMLVSDNLSGERLMAGEEYEFTAEFQNTNGRETIYNLTITVKSDREDVSLENAAFYFGEVRPRETITLPVTVSADRNVLAGRVALSFELSYENEQGTSYSQTEEASLEIYQLPQVLLEGFQLAPQLYSTDMAESGFSIRNTGKAEIYNVRLEFAAQGLFAAADVYAGNLEAGSSYEGTLRIYVGNKTMTSLSDPGNPLAEEAYGQTSGTLILLYEDADGGTYRQVQDFSTEILKPQVIELSVEKEEVQTNQWQTAVLVLAACLFLMILVLMGWRLKKSRDALADLLAMQKEGRS